ncbi:MAG: TIGR00270 family protein [Thermoprotei archaeon]|nr:TIGR00270 family protein [Thermoprotei archaeon]
MECELCGAKIQGRPIKIRLDGVILNVCNACAKRYSKYVIRDSAIQRSMPRPRRVVRIRTQPKLRELEYEIVEDFNVRIRKAREELGLTRELLAQELGEKESVIRRIEEGRLVPTIDMARKLERILKIKLLEPAESVSYEKYVKKRGGPILTLGDIVVIKDRKKGTEEYEGKEH